jgi:hypothetical protein
MADVCDSIEEVEPSLTLEGLRIIYEKIGKGKNNCKRSRNVENRK